MSSAGKPEYAAGRGCRSTLVTAGAYGAVAAASRATAQTREREGSPPSLPTEAVPSVLTTDFAHHGKEGHQTVRV